MIALERICYAFLGASLMLAAVAAHDWATRDYWCVASKPYIGWRPSGEPYVADVGHTFCVSQLDYMLGKRPVVPKDLQR